METKDQKVINYYNCCVPKCGKRFKGISGNAHVFPKEKELQEKWLKSLEMTSFFKFDKVCFAHFKPEHYVVYEEDTKRKRLKKGVVPILETESSEIPKNEEKSEEESEEKIEKSPVTKMVFRCCVPSCKKRFKHAFGMFYGVPKDQKSKEKWLEALKMSSFRKSHKVCFRHFTPEHFAEGSGKKKRLQKGVVPIRDPEHSSENAQFAIEVPIEPKISKTKDEKNSQVDPLKITKKYKKGTIRTCCVPLCRKTFVHKSGLGFAFPKDEKLQEKWLEALKMSLSPTFSRTNKVCYRHFKPEHLGKEHNDTKRLRKGAVPILFPDQCLEIDEIDIKTENENKTEIFEQFNNQKNVEADTSETDPFIKTENENVALEENSEIDPEFDKNQFIEKKARVTTRKCCVPKCGKNFKHTPGMGFNFPVNEKYQKKWLTALEMSSFSKNVKVCFRHFTPEHFTKGYGTKKILRKGIVPILHPDSSSENKTETDPFIKTENENSENIALKENSEIDPLEIRSSDNEKMSKVKKCSVPKCAKRFLQISGMCFQFPSDEKYQEKWLAALEMSSFSKSTKVCFRHFKPEHYAKGSGILKRLRKCIVPILDPDQSSEITHIKVETETHSEEKVEIFDFEKNETAQIDMKIEIDDVTIVDPLMEEKFERFENESKEKNCEIDLFIKQENIVEEEKTEIDPFFEIQNSDIKIKTEMETFVTETTVEEEISEKDPLEINLNFRYVARDTKVCCQNCVKILKENEKVSGSKDEKIFKCSKCQHISAFRISMNPQYKCQFCTAVFFEWKDKNWHENEFHKKSKKRKKDKMSEKFDVIKPAKTYVRKKSAVVKNQSFQI